MTVVRSRYRLEDALAVANTAHGPGAHRGVRITAAGLDHDHLALPPDARRFLVDHAIVTPASDPGPDHLARLRALRSLLALAATRRTAPLPTIDALLAGVAPRVYADGRMATRRSGWDGLVDELILPLVELAEAAPRLRRCQNAACRWIFVDRSRNASRRWCEMAVCGNRAKGRRHRHRIA